MVRKKKKRSNGGAPSITPQRSEPPPFMRWLIWFMKEFPDWFKEQRFAHKLLTVTVLFIIISYIPVKVFIWPSIQSWLYVHFEGKVLMNQLRQSFIDARDAFSKTGDESGFRKVDDDVARLKQYDAEHGAIWYFQGEVKRLTNIQYFDSTSCPRLKQLPPDVDLSNFERDFQLYLATEKSLPPLLTQNGPDIKKCYKNYSRGYCQQRTGWIYHLLANDYYAESMVATDKTTASEKLRNAADAATIAMQEYPRSSENPLGPGFSQCISDKALQAEIAAELPKP